MEIRKNETYNLKFSGSDVKLIASLIKEQVGTTTIDEILDSFNYIFDWYRYMMDMFRKIYNSGFTTGERITLTPNEYRVLGDILSKAYNDGKREDSKAQIKEICDAIQLQREAENRNFAI